MKKIKTILKLLRVKEWRAFILILLFGFLASQAFDSHWLKIILFFIMSFLFLAYGYLINDCFDTQEDSFDKNKINLILLGKASFLKGFLFSLLSALLGLIIAIFFDFKTFLFSLLGVVCVFLYSVPPFRLKSRPFLDFLSHGFFGGTFFFLLPFFAFQKTITFPYFLLSLLIFYFSMILEIRNHLEDYEFDKKANLKTTVCFLGKEKSEAIVYLLIIVFPFLFFPFFFLEKTIFLLFFFSLILFLFFFNQRQNYKIFDLYAIFLFLGAFYDIIFYYEQSLF